MAGSLIYIFLFFFTVFILLRLYQSSRPTTTKNPPPSPPKLPIIGNLHQIGPLLHHSLFSLSRRYGANLMLLHMGSVPTLVVSSAAAAREVMHTHDLKFASRPSKERFDILFYDSKEIASAPYGERWKQTKKLLVHNFLNSTKVQTYSRLRDEEIATVLHKITDLSKQNKAVNISDLFLKYSETVAGSAAFGRKLFSETGLKVFQEFPAVIFSFYFEDMHPQLAWLDRITGATAKAKSLAKNIDDFMESAIKERLNGKIDHGLGEGVEPFIDTLLRIQKEGVDGFAVETDIIKALLMDAYISGTEASSTLIEWVMTELLAHPSSLKKVQAEVRMIVNGKQEITDDDVRQMEYLKAVIMESTRLHPPAPVPAPRFTTEDVKAMGYEIAKGTTVLVNIWAIGRDPTVWDNPDEFVPERFIGSSSSVDFVNHNFKLLTFGAGRRSCPGRGFSMTMNEILLANVLYKFDFALPDNTLKEDGVYMDEVFGATAHKKTPLLAFATPFSSS